MTVRAILRKIETRQIEVSGGTLADVQQQLAAQCPEGFVLTDTAVSMAKAGAQITAVGTYARRDETKEIEVATREDLPAAVPEGWQVLYTLTA